MTMLKIIFDLLDKLPLLKKEKNPNIAAMIGFLFGGVGLLLYGMFFIDLLIGIAIIIAVLVVFWYRLQNIDPLYGYLGGGIILGLYSYFRVWNSNRRLKGLSPKKLKRNLKK